jgi:hypothetical protein
MNKPKTPQEIEQRYRELINKQSTEGLTREEETQLGELKEEIDRLFDELDRERRELLQQVLRDRINKG